MLTSIAQAIYDLLLKEKANALNGMPTVFTIILTRRFWENDDYLCLHNQHTIVMETSKAYFDDILRRFDVEQPGRTLFQFCRDEGIDYKSLTAYRRSAEAII